MLTGSAAFARNYSHLRSVRFPAQHWVEGEWASFGHLGIHGAFCVMTWIFPNVVV